MDMHNNNAVSKRPMKAEADVTWAWLKLYINFRFQDRTFFFFVEWRWRKNGQKESRAAGWTLKEAFGWNLGTGPSPKASKAFGAGQWLCTFGSSHG